MLVNSANLNTYIEAVQECNTLSGDDCSAKANCTLFDLGSKRIQLDDDYVNYLTGDYSSELFTCIPSWIGFRSRYFENRDIGSLQRINEAIADCNTQKQQDPNKKCDDVTTDVEDFNGNTGTSCRSGVRPSEEQLEILRTQKRNQAVCRPSWDNHKSMLASPERMANYITAVQTCNAETDCAANPDCRLFEASDNRIQLDDAFLEIYNTSS